MCLRHIKTAENHFHALRFISDSAQATGIDMTGWKVALVYYVVCLYVRALACQRGKAFTRHYEVMQWLTGQADTLVFRDAYRNLEEYSRDARYDGRKFTTEGLKSVLRLYDEIMDRLLPLLAKERLPGLLKLDAARWVL